MAKKSTSNSGENPDYNRQPPPSNYVIDLKKAGAVWEKKFTSLSDLFCTKTEIPNGKPVIAPTHMLGQSEETVRLIAYRNSGKMDRKVDDSDQEDLARFILPGEIAIVIKFHCPKPDQRAIECLKLQCTHAQVAIGVEFNGKKGVISVTNPQKYHKTENSAGVPLGLFGTPDYPSIFIKPKFPDTFSPLQKRQYVDNIRTWLIIANALTQFPDKDVYNGNDPLATINIKEVKILGDFLLAALTGDMDAKNWLKDPKNHVYCAELIHIALNLGIHYPLNKATIGGERYGEVTKRLNSKDFLKGNKNKYVGRTHLQMAPEALKPIWEETYSLQAGCGSEEVFDPCFAIQPFTIADIMEKYIQQIIPREKNGEHLAPIQAGILEVAKPEFMKVMKLDKYPRKNLWRMEMEQLYQQMIEVVKKPHNSYEEFSRKFTPLLWRARRLPDLFENGVINAFIPPHCFLVRATNSIEGKPWQGLLGWQYLGHGLHESMLKRV